MSILKFLDTSPTIEEVERNIQLLKEDIRTLEHYRNARLLIVSRLPSEVLSLIFEFLALKRHNQQLYAYSNGYANHLPVTQVCRLWRNVALNSPRMWGCIYAHTRKELAQLFLERVRSAPLYLRSFVNRAKADTILLLLKRCDQLKEIEIDECEIDWLRRITKLNLPVLEKLTIGLLSERPVKIHFTSEVEPGTTPTLRELSLTKCSFDLDAPFFSQLRTLKIANSWHVGLPIILNGNLLAMGNVVAALQNMEHLEILELAHATGSQEIPRDITANLPNLTSICITVAHINGLAIFRHITCPSIRSMQAECVNCVGPDALSPVASAFYALIPSVPWKTVLSVRPATSASRATMKIWPQASDEPFRSENPAFKISIIGPTNYQSSVALCSALPPQVQFSLDVRLMRSYSEHSSEDIDEDGLRAFMRGLTCVEKLHTGHIEDIIAILTDAPKVVTRRRPVSAFSLPSLKHIVWYASGSLQYKERKLKQLTQLLAARRAAAGIETLTVRGCCVNDKDLHPIRAHVTTLKHKYK